MNGWLCIYGAAEIKTAGHCKYTTIKNGIYVCFLLLLFEYVNPKATVKLLLNDAFFFSSIQFNLALLA